LERLTAALDERVRFHRIQQVRAHEYVADQIRRHIALRLIGPGESLPSERELTTMFGVGRPTIQLALRLLEHDHLVETRRGRAGGTFVLQPAEDTVVKEELIVRTLRHRREIEELLELRQTLEPRISGLAAEAHRQHDLDAMRRQLMGMSEAATEPDYMRYDTQFHLAVARATGNRRFVEAIEEIRAGLNDVISLLPESDTWHGRISGEHESIVSAVAARDPEAAESAMDRHVASSDQGIRAVLEAVRRWSGRARKGRDRKEERQ
jgi:GntR family transcriptional regulator, transcriptional repressor for pyruvate dehydrogenase complex